VIPVDAGSVSGLAGRQRRGAGCPRRRAV